MTSTGHPNGNHDQHGFNSHGAVMTCELCGERRKCIDNDGIVACSTCQAELLPSSWGL